MDLSIVLKQDVNNDEFKKIEGLQKFISEKYPHFRTDGVEMIFVSKYAIGNYLNEKTYLTAVAPGDPLQKMICGPKFLIYWYIIYNYGKTLVGKPAREVFPNIPNKDFVEMSNKVCLNKIPFWKDTCKQTLHEQFYAVITCCRALYIAKNKTYPAKSVSKNWAKKEYSPFANLIEFCWNQRGKWKPENKPDDSKKYQEIIKFLDFTANFLSNI